MKLTKNNVCKLILNSLVIIILTLALTACNSNSNNSEVIEYSIDEIGILSLSGGQETDSEQIEMVNADDRYIYALNILRPRRADANYFYVNGMHRFDYQSEEKKFIKNNNPNKLFAVSSAACDDEVLVSETYGVEESDSFNSVLLSFGADKIKQVTEIKELIEPPELISCGGKPIIIKKTKSDDKYYINGLLITEEQVNEIFSFECDMNTSVNIGNNFNDERYVISCEINGTQHLITGNSDGILTEKKIEYAVGETYIFDNLAVAFVADEEKNKKILFYYLDTDEVKYVDTYKTLGNLVKLSDEYCMATDYAYNPYLMDIRTGEITEIDLSSKTGFTSFSKEGKNNIDAEEINMTGIERGDYLKFHHVGEKKIIIETSKDGIKEKKYYSFSITN